MNMWSGFRPKFQLMMSEKNTKRKGRRDEGQCQLSIQTRVAIKSLVIVDSKIVDSSVLYQVHCTQGTVPNSSS